MVARPSRMAKHPWSGRTSWHQRPPRRRRWRAGTARPGGPSAAQGLAQCTPRGGGGAEMGRQATGGMRGRRPTTRFGAEQGRLQGERHTGHSLAGRRRVVGALNIHNGLAGRGRCRQCPARRRCCQRVFLEGVGFPISANHENRVRSGRSQQVNEGNSD